MSSRTMRNTDRLSTTVAALAIVAVLVQPVVLPAQVTTPADVGAEATKLVNQLNPLNAALGPLIDRAIEKGDTTLQRRLEQLQGIISGALRQLDDILKNRITQIDEALRARITQVASEARDIAAIVNQDATDRIDQLNTDLAGRVDQLQASIGNLIASLPIPIEPLLIIDPTMGITVPQQSGTETIVTVAGSGLHKNNTAPVVTFSNPQGPTQNARVVSSSMGFVEIAFPNQFLTVPEGSSKEFTVAMRVRRGNAWLLVPSYTTLSFPLHVCGKLPKYLAAVSVAASGQRWDRRTIPHPQSRDLGEGRTHGFYIDCDAGNHNNSYTVYAVASEGYDVDPDPAPGCSPGQGLCVGAESGRNYHRYNPGPGQAQLYCDGRDGSSNELIWGVSVRQRKRVDMPSCGAPKTASKDLAYGRVTQVPLDPAGAAGPCLEAGLQPPSYVYTVDLTNVATGAKETYTLTPGLTKRVLNNLLAIDFTNANIVTFNLSAACRWSYPLQN